MSIELILGLGNPGRRYATTRHNVGFRVVEELAQRHGEARWIRCPLCHVTSTLVAPRLILARPRTFMNRSGTAAAWLLAHLELEPEHILVVVDDIELGIGALRLRRSGGPGTHNGLRDICRLLGPSFPRLRVGVRGSAPWQDLAAYVLSPFAPGERRAIAAALVRAADTVEVAALQGIDEAMNRSNRRVIDSEPG